MAAASSAGGFVPRVLEREGVAAVPCDCCTLHIPLCAGIAALFAAPGLGGREKLSFGGESIGPVYVAMTYPLSKASRDCAQERARATLRASSIASAFRIAKRLPWNFAQL